MAVSDSVQDHMHMSGKQMSCKKRFGSIQAGPDVLSGQWSTAVGQLCRQHALGEQYFCVPFCILKENLAPFTLQVMRGMYATETVFS